MIWRRTMTCKIGEQPPLCELLLTLNAQPIWGHCAEVLILEQAQWTAVGDRLVITLRISDEFVRFLPPLPKSPYDARDWSSIEGAELVPEGADDFVIVNEK